MNEKETIDKKITESFETLLSNTKNPFPVEVFPIDIQKFIIETEETLNFPMDYVGSAILVVVASTIGNKCMLKFRNEWQSPSNLFLAIVGQTGTAKTPSINHALKPINEIQNNNNEFYTSKIREYKEQIKLDNSIDIEKPFLKQLILDDFSIEAVNEVHIKNPNALLIVKDEITGWVADFNKYRSNGSDQEVWLQMWSNQPIIVNRKGCDAQFIKKPNISVLGGIPPSQLPKLFNGNRGENGFVERILFAFPERSPKMVWNEKEMNSFTVERYREIIYKIYNDDTIDKVVEFTSSAKSKFIEYFNSNASFIDDKNTPNYLKGMYSKMNLSTGRLALILEHLFWASGEGETPDVSYVHQKSVEGAVKLAKYFEYNFIKVMNQINLIENGQISTAEKIDFAKLLSKKKYSTREIAKLLDVSAMTISNWLKK